MNYIILALLFILSGFFMKYSDDLYDVNHEQRLSTILGIICAIASAAASLYNTDAAYIFISILIGNLIVLKVDGIHHIVTFDCFCSNNVYCRNSRDELGHYADLYFGYYM
ncbi:hypothetical protein [Methanobrevibacter sp.]|uniref:hypothetical protein n=1 Tax=Methanobrevibacter sp. TaxID=66852 RepID=UPI0025D9F5B1|nr:hypothetical protein [Methanobrevibacter sp.]